MSVLYFLEQGYNLYTTRAVRCKQLTAWRGVFKEFQRLWLPLVFCELLTIQIFEERHGL